MSATRGSLCTRRRRIVAISAVALCVALFAAALAEVREPARGSARQVASIPFELIENKIVIRGQINGSRELRLVFDTGMIGGALLNNPALAREIGLEMDGQVTAAGVGAGKTVSAGLARGARIRLGDVEFAQQTVVVMPEDSDYSRATRLLPFDGIVGYSLLDRYVCRIDHDAKRLTLYRKKGYRYEGQGTEVPIVVQAQKSYVVAELVLADDAAVPVKLIIDTGAGCALSLIEDSSEAIKAPPETISTTLGRGIQGKRGGRIGRMRGLRVGGFMLRNPVTTFPFSPIRGLSADRQGLLGNDALKRFNIVFDYRRKRMILEPSSYFKDPFEYDMLGLQLDPLPGERGFTVDEVLDASPAGDAGILAGDRVVAIDGRQAWQIPLGEVRKMFRSAPGDLHRLTLRRGDEELHVEVRLRRLI